MKPDMHRRFSFHYILSALLLFAVACAYGASGGKKKAVNTFAKPDFAYPATVAANAEKAMEEAGKKGDAVQRMQAAVQIVLSRNSISRGNAPQMALMLDSLASVSATPYKELYLSLEAQLYSEMYLSNRWVYDDRVLPADYSGGDPASWSRKIYVSKIDSLLTASLSGKKALRGVPLKDLGAVIATPKGSEIYFKSVFDFLALRAIDIASSLGSGVMEIPFGGTRSPRPLDEMLIDTQEAYYREKGEVAPLSYYLVRKSYGMEHGNVWKYLVDSYKDFEDSPYSLIILAHAAGYADSSEKEFLFWNLAQNALSRFPDAPASAALKSQVQRISAPKVNVDFNSMALPGAEPECKAVLSNISSAYLLVLEKDSGFDASYKSLLRGSRYNPSAAELKNLLRRHSRVAGSRLISASGSVPFSDTATVKLPELGLGEYLVIPSSSAEVSGAFEYGLQQAMSSTLKVTAMQMFSSSVSSEKPGNRIYVVDGKDSKPLQGITVKVEDSKKISNTYITDKQGAVDVGIKDNYALATAINGKDRISDKFYFSWFRPSAPDTVRAVVLTDLSVYRPGDKAGFAAVVYDPSGRKPVGNKEISCELCDANGETVGKKQLTTDADGRVAAQFDIPSGKLLGQYSIVARNGENYIGAAYFQVAEYVAPKFFVSLEAAGEGGNAAGGRIVFAGTAATYSGMPVAGAKVAYRIDTVNRFWRWGNSPRGVYTGETDTDASGKFNIELPADGLKGTPFEHSGFSIVATVIDMAGESQESVPLDFFVGKNYEISADLPDHIDAGGSDGIKVSVTDITGRKVPAEVGYVITDKDRKPVAEGRFTSPDFRYDFSGLGSGAYRIEFRIPSDSTYSVKKSFILYRPGDSRPPVETALWLPVSKYKAKDNSGSVEITVGSSYPGSYILCEVTGSKGFAERKWIQVSEGNRKISVPVKDEKLNVTFSTVHNLEFMSQNVEVEPCDAEPPLEIKVESFRDKVTAGASETWRFRFISGKKGEAGIPVIVSMANKSLDAIAPFSWSMPSLYSAAPLRADMRCIWVRKNAFTVMNKMNPVVSSFDFPSLPSFDLYGNGSLLGGYRMYGSARHTKMRAYAAPLANDGAVVEMAVDEAAPVYMSAVATALEGKAAGVSLSDASGDAAPAAQQFRPVELPLAFFRPDLKTDGDGNLDLSFTVPDFNTTWRLHMLGYTPSMQAAMKELETVASRPVMVSSLLPRFLRSGDKARLAVTVYNNTSSPRLLSGRIEVVNPLDGKMLVDYSSGAFMLDAMSSKVIYADIDVPVDVQELVFRTWAESENYSDGEQSPIAVLPASSPVFESSVFYLSPGKQDFSMRLPEYGSGSSLTIQYCDNPVWYCISSLPAMTVPGNNSIFSLLYSYYGTALTSGIMRDYPAIAESLSSWTEGKSATPLDSRLSADSLLKLYPLDATIWVNNARSSELRSMQLSRYLDKDAAASSLKEISGRLALLRNSDGGFSWCPGMESSLFASEGVVRMAGMLYRRGYLGKDSEMYRLAASAIDYCDSVWMSYYRHDGKNFDLLSLVPYLYVRSAFGIQPKARGFSALKAKSLDALQRSWRELAPYRAAEAAVLLYGEKRVSVPRAIIKSLSEKAMHSDEKGMWFDNIVSSYSEFPALLTTAKVLEAFAAVDPASPCVEEMRQWLLLQKQVQDWGDSRNTAEVVYALLSSGADWMAASPAPVITLDGMELVPESKEASTGAFVMNLDPVKASGAMLRIEKEGAAPSWGGVMSQRVAPVSEVRPASVPSLSISKRIYRLDGSEASAGDLKVGDKVRVTLTVVNSDNMDYVAISDLRPACLQPIDQLSGYTGADGLYFYRETGKKSTDIFISYLPKGTHQITYDCFVTFAGTYSSGTATAQSQYYPMITAHSAGEMLTVEP